ncbi:MAG: hypothetical protein FJW32_22175 [Acidobacteria bacterium]|nr:hypothetical protein [Acidobacteriota bacterium]
MRRLFFLNILLLGGIAAATLKWLELREETAKREALVSGSAPKLPAAKPVAAAPMPEKTVAANYFDVAARLLFSKDRNPTVVIAPPPAPVMPALPLTYGVLMLAEPPIIMMAGKKGEPQKGFRPGDQIGDFKIVTFDNRTITFDWKGQKVLRTISELADRDAATAALMNQQNIPAADTKPVQQVQTIQTARPEGPGTDIGGDMRACVANDSTAAGSVKDGYRKVVSASPFGTVCRWEKIK